MGYRNEHYGAGENLGVAHGYVDHDFDDVLDERYLIDRAEHEAHAGDGDEEAEQGFWADQNEQAWAASQDGDDEDECEGHESLDGAHMGEAVYCDGSCRPRRQPETVLGVDVSGTPGTTVHGAIEALHQVESQPPRTLLELIEAYAEDPRFGLDKITEIKRRWTMATNTQITGSLDNQPGAALILNILDGRS